MILVTPFWIDTEGYSDRDRLMFVAGVEFQMIREELEVGGARPIHRENETPGTSPVLQHGAGMPDHATPRVRRL